VVEAEEKKGVGVEAKEKSFVVEAEEEKKGVGVETENVLEERTYIFSILRIYYFIL
jgi:hypothetical protein